MMQSKNRCLPLLVMFTFFISCQSGNSQNVLEPKDFQKQLNKNPDAVLLDVRTPAEYSEGHLSGAENIDFKDASFKDNVNGLDSAKTYFVYCRSGGRSEKAAELMRQSGLKNVYDLKGGILNWQEKGLQVEKDGN